MGWFVLWVLFLTAGFAGIALLVNKGKEDSEMKDEIKNKAIDLVKEIYNMGYQDAVHAKTVFAEIDKQEGKCGSCKHSKVPAYEEPCLGCCYCYNSAWESKE